MELIIEIDKGVYVKANEILFILKNNKTKTIKYLKDNAKQNDNLVFYETKRSEKNSVVVLKNGDIFVVNFNILTLTKKCSSMGIDMLDINDDYFVNIFYIKAFFNLDFTSLSGLKRKCENATDILQFVHQGEKRKSFIVLHNNMLVFLSKDSNEILDFNERFNSAIKNIKK